MFYIIFSAVALVVMAICYERLAISHIDDGINRLNALTAEMDEMIQACKFERRRRFDDLC